MVCAWSKVVNVHQGLVSVSISPDHLHNKVVIIFSSVDLSMQVGSIENTESG